MKFPKKAWESFKQTPQYLSSLSEFQELYDIENIDRMFKKHCPDYSKDYPVTYLTSFFLDLFDEEDLSFGSYDECERYLVELFGSELSEDDGTIIIREDDGKAWVSLVPALSVALSAYCHEYFIPYLFPLRFSLFRRIMGVLQIDLPETPLRSKYFERYMYYKEFCDIMIIMRDETGMTPEEACVFLYEFMPNHYLEDEEPAPLHDGMQAWFIGGKKIGSEVEADYIFWQANEETWKGDIMVFYETSPKSAITGIWRAKEDGICDPFFGYYAHTYIGDEIRLEHPITLNELRSDKMMCDNGLVRKNFQGVNGWPLTTDEYNHIVEMIRERECTAVPEIYCPGTPDVNIKYERDVSYQLLVGLLKQIGISNYSAEFKTHVGRKSEVFPDFVADVRYSENERPAARITFEVKKRMKNNREIVANYTQGDSYARALNSELLVICDERIIQVHPRKDGAFCYERNVRFTWDEAFGSRFAEITRLLK